MLPEILPLGTVIGEAADITVGQPTLPIGTDTAIGAGTGFPRAVPPITAIVLAITTVIPADIVRLRPHRRRNRLFARRWSSISKPASAGTELTGLPTGTVDMDGTIIGVRRL